MSSPIAVPMFLKFRPRGNSYPSPKDMEFINRVKKPLLPLPPSPSVKEKSKSVTETMLQVSEIKRRTI
jgi:hypothetical protein